jgi:adenylate cyclase
MSPEQAADGGRLARWRLHGRSGADLQRKTSQLTAAMTLLSHLVGATVVVILLVVIFPVPDEVNNEPDLIVGNLIAAVIYVIVAELVGTRFGLGASRPATQWLREERDPSEEEVHRLLRLPSRLLLQGLLLWLAAIPVFVAINASSSVTLAFEIAVTIAIGGVTTASLAYLVATRLGRTMIGQALADAEPREYDVPGVGARTMLAWALASAVPLTGIVLLGGFSLGLDVDSHALARSMLFLGITALITGFLGSLIVARSISDPLQRLRASLADVESGDLEARVRVDDATEVGFLQAGFNRMVAGLHERERVRDLFGRHVGEDVAERALEEEVEMGGEQRQVAALFADVVGSTGIASRKSPTEVVSLLNGFFEIVVETVSEHGGFVNKFEGDGALCVFGAPLDADDFAGSALAAAREMSSRFASELDELEAAIGVSAGDAVAGNVGAADRFEYTVIGDPVNEAARLTELAKEKPGRVLASEAAVELARSGERERWELGEEVQLRGREAKTRLASPRHAEASSEPGDGAGEEPG